MVLETMERRIEAVDGVEGYLFALSLVCASTKVSKSLKA